MGVLFQYSGENLPEMWGEYADIIREEFYAGHFQAEQARYFDITIEKLIESPISLTRVISNVGQSYRRSWHDIRGNNIGVRVIWFVKRGSLKITKSVNSCIVNKNECAILDSRRPFFAQSYGDEEGYFDAIQAIIPAHLFISHLPDAIEFDHKFTIDDDRAQVVSCLLNLMMDQGKNISANAIKPLVSAFLEGIGDNLAQTFEGPTRRCSVTEKRLLDIKTYITKHLTDSELSYDEVALKCGISPRYLCYVLKANNTSFSALLWSQRLPKAREWLGSLSLIDYPIQEIAFMAGFKSSAHFSRMFKAHYNQTPKDYRNAAIEAAREQCEA